jgi:polysaccharide biosynthesis protein PelG
MAGIGFQLKNLFKENSFLWRIKGFAFSSIVVAGPMVLCILIIVLAQSFLSKINTPFYERELFQAGTLYSFVFSQLITGGFTMLLSRYLADQLHSGKHENVLSSLYGILSVCLFIGGVTGIIFYSFSPLDLPFKIFSYLFIMELIITWLLMIYISALKDYMKVIKSFVAGVIISASLIWISYLFLNLKTATGVFACMDIGFLTIILLFLRSVKKQFPVNNNRYFDFLVYIQKYPSLFLIGLIYTLGLYGHSFIVWGSSLNTVINDTFYIAPLYDTPVFYSYLTILPAMVMFVISVETSFYEEYKRFYSLIRGSASFGEIKEAQEKMFNVLSREFEFIMEFQLFFTIYAISLGTRLLPISSEQVDIFNILTLGNYFFIMMFILVQILLYFDDRRGALIVISCYTTLQLVLSPITVYFEHYGYSSFISGLLGLGVALVRIYYYSRNFGYYTFCSQPLIKKDEKLFMQRMAEKLNSLNGVGGNYETKE